MKTDTTAKLTINVPSPLYDEYEDLYMDFRRTYRKLKRVDFIQLVMRYGLKNIRAGDAIEAGVDEIKRLRSIITLAHKMLDRNDNGLRQELYDLLAQGLEETTR